MAMKKFSTLKIEELEIQISEIPISDFVYLKVTL